MAKKEIRTKYIKSLMEDKDNLAKILEESTKDSLDNLLDEKVNRSLRNMLSESEKEDSFTEEEVNDDEPVFDADTKDDEDSDNAAYGQKGGCKNGECANGTCCDDDETDGDEVWDDVEDCKDEDGEYDLREKDINTVLKVLQSMNPEDGVRIIKNDDNTATVEPDGDEAEFIIDIEAPEANDFEDDENDEPMDSEDGLDFDGEGEDDDDEMMDDIDLDSLDDGKDEDDDYDGDDEGDDDGATFELEIGDDDNDEETENEDNMVNEGNINLGYTDNYQKKTAMTMPHDKGDGEGDSRFDAGAPKGDGKRWVGHKGANNGNPYTKKTKQPMSEQFDECDEENLYEVILEDGMEECDEGRAKGARPNGRAHRKGILYDTNNEWADFKHVASQNGEYQGDVNESRHMQAINRQANAILAENKELKDIAAQIKNKLNEAVVINSSLSKIIKLMTENSTTRDEKINILNRFNKVNSLNESRALYNQISGELKNAHSVNNSLMSNQLTEAKSSNKNMIVETNMLNQSDDLKQILDLQKRLMNL